MHTKISPKVNVFLPIFLVLALLPYFIVSVYAMPVADDFSYAYISKTNNLWTAWVHEYFHWGGRYSSNLFVLLNPVNTDIPWLYNAVPPLLIFLLILSVHRMFLHLNIGCFSQLEVFVAAIVFVLLFLSKMPIISEGLYWYTGSVTYFGGLIFLMCFLNAFILFRNKLFFFKNRLLHCIILCLLVIITIGFNEIVMLSVLIFIAIGVLIAKRVGKHNNFQISLLVLALLSSFVIIFSPGVQVRSQYFPENHNVVHSFMYSVAQVGRFFFLWIFNAPLLVASILFYPINRRLSENIDIFSKSFYMQPLWSVGLLFMTIFIGVFPPYWATGILGQHRTLNVSYFLFLLVWFVNLNVLYNRNYVRFEIQNKLHRLIPVLLLIATLVITKNSYHVISDLFSGRANSYKVETYHRLEKVKHAKDSVFLEPLHARPISLFVLDITTNPNDWRNKTYAQFALNDSLKVILKE